MGAFPLLPCKNPSVFSHNACLLSVCHKSFSGCPGAHGSGPGLNRGIISQHSFHPTHTGSALVDSDISVWHIQTNRFTWDGETKRRKKKKAEEGMRAVTAWIIR